MRPTGHQHRPTPALEVCTIPEIIIGFEVHQPLRLKRELRHEQAAPNGPDDYFDAENRMILNRFPNDATTWQAGSSSTGSTTATTPRSRIPER